MEWREGLLRMVFADVLLHKWKSDANDNEEKSIIISTIHLGNYFYHRARYLNW